MIAASLALFAGRAAFAADATATMEKTHLCCQSCLKAAEKAVTSVKGATAKCDAKAGTVTITAPDAEAAQKAVDALVQAGFYGKVTGAKLKEEAATGKATSATVSEIHNCCKKCTTAINNAVKNAPGVKGEAGLKETTFTLTGDFQTQALVDALHAAGFHAKVATK
jgi:copper chaperone CopZ